VEDCVAVCEFLSVSLGTNSVVSDSSGAGSIGGWPASSGILYTNAPHLSETTISVEDCVAVCEFLSVSLGTNSAVCNSFSFIL